MPYQVFSDFMRYMKIMVSNMRFVFVSFAIAVFELCYSADIKSMRTNILNYFSQSRYHGDNNVYKLHARKFIYDEFIRYGLETQYQFFTDYTDTYQHVIFANVIGVLRGERFGQANDKILGVEAHYDTVPGSPGVDDNGAGVAALLEVIRQVTNANKQGTKRQNTIIFASFDGEELDYIGGYSYTTNWLGPYLEANYGNNVASLTPHGVIVMDTMMNYDTNKNSQVIPRQYMQEFQQYFPNASSSIASDNFEGDFLLLTYRQPTNDSKLAANFVSAWNGLGQPQFEIESFPLPISDLDVLNKQAALSNFMRSDHVALWYYNVPAIFISDSANFRGDMVKCYHHACDNVTNLLTDENIKFLGKTADAITTTLNRLSETSGGPISDAPVNHGINMLLLAAIVLQALSG